MRESNISGERRVVQRRYAPKTRTGCLTCKIRRVKCDEAKPNCKRCTSTGRKCDGYIDCQDSTKTISKPGQQQQLSITVSLSINANFDALEQRTFDFFRHRTTPCMSGYFNDTVWDRIVLQISHSQPAVRYAVNALGALHEERFLRRSAGNQKVDVGSLQTSFPAKQYSKALNGMQALLKEPKLPLDVVLLCALLFIHFEALREAFVPALVHAENAIKLLHASSTFDAQKVDDNLVRSMMRIDIQGAMYLGMRVPGLPFYTAATDSTLPSAFHDINQARDLVNTWTCRMFHFMRINADDHKFRDVGDIPLEHIAKAQDLEQTFIDLNRLLEDFMHKPTVKLTFREQHGLGMLRSRAKINRIVCAGCLYSEATIYDRFFTEFEEILTICTYIMDSDNADRRLFSVSLDEGLLHPLFFIATHCRDSRTRHKALVQLKKLPTKQGIWHVEAMTRTAEVCINYEEALLDKPAGTALCSDIPEWRRIHSAGFDGWDKTDPKTSVRAHMRVRPNGMDGEWHDLQELIEW